ncbi:MAG: class I SAM-dependent methyltransferase [Verrucomicrobia bacterium]|nr:class I SAM-dependent methyltransferase [Verrucomicrobiota bacterium]
MNPHWYEDFFHGVANDLWRKCVSAEQTRAEADFLEKTLGPKTRLLDVPCGNGRHALELARRGCRVTGLDISKEFVEEASGGAKAEGLPADFICGNMKALPWQAEFDGAFCFGNAFGYLEFADMMAFVTGVARALRPGGRFVIETGSVAEAILPTLKGREWYQIDDILFAIENRYLADVSCLETEATFVRNGQTEKRTWWHWVYTVGEIRRMLTAAGFAVEHLYGSLDGQPFRASNQCLFVVARGPAAEKIAVGNRL